MIYYNIIIITMTETEKQLDELMRELEGKDKVADHQTRRMFNLNNIIYPDILEYTVSCGSCRGRVYNRLKKYWQENIKNKI
jgi:hypothetical protein